MIGGADVAAELDAKRAIDRGGWRLAFKVSCKTSILSCLRPSLAQVWGNKVEQEVRKYGPFDEMEAFATVVDQGGLQACSNMRISKSAVSKHISILEATWCAIAKSYHPPC